LIDPLRVGHEPSSNHGNRFYWAICVPDHTGKNALLKLGFVCYVGIMTHFQVVNPAAKSGGRWLARLIFIRQHFFIVVGRNGEGNVACWGKCLFFLE